MCLLIGAPGVGKTLLLKRLHSCSQKGSYTGIDDAPATIPTVGTNLVNFLTSKKTEMTVRELGGCMAPIWHKYYTECHALMFMVDMSNKCQVAASCIQMLEVLNNPKLQQTQILLLLNKIDLPGCITRQEIDFLLRLEDVQKHAAQKISIIEISAREGQGLSDVAQWIQHNGKVNS